MTRKPVTRDILRRRPEKMRYSYIAVSSTNVHTGLSYWGLETTYKNHGVKDLYVIDLLRKIVVPVKEPVEDFMKRWRLEYDNPKWDYLQEITAGVPVPDVKA